MIKVCSALRYFRTLRVESTALGMRDFNFSRRGYLIAHIFIIIQCAMIKKRLFIKSKFKIKGYNRKSILLFAC